MSPPPSCPISKAFLDAVQKEVERMANEEIAAAQRMIVKRVRESVGQITTTVLEHVTFEKYGQTLRIEVDFRGLTSHAKTDAR